jgi:hypothetical protein
LPSSCGDKLKGSTKRPTIMIKRNRRHSRPTGPEAAGSSQ